MSFPSTSSGQPDKGHALVRGALPLAGLVLAAAIWWLLTRSPGETSLLAGSFQPGETARTIWHLVASGRLWNHIGASLWRIAAGLGFAVAAGLPTGILLGLSKSAERSTSALFQFLRMISPLSWMPIAVMFFGIGDRPVIFLVAIAAVWPVILNTSAGVASVNPTTLLLARSLCATFFETLWHVVLPSILSHVLTGLRLALGIAWIVLVPAEMLGVRAGLGYFILDTRDRLAYSELLAVILIIGVIGYALDTLLRLAHRGLTHQD